MSNNKPSVTLSLPDVMYDPTWVGLGEVDYDPEDIGDPNDPSTWGFDDE